LAAGTAVDGAPEGEVEWPDETQESSFLSESASRQEAPLPPGAREAPSGPSEKLPALDSLVARVPPEVLGLLDDLFRAKFTGVRRYAPAGAPAVTPSTPARPSGGP
jgi:hypothetical protein